MVDPFWHKLQEAYTQVKLKPEVSIEFEMNGLRASVDCGTDMVTVYISEVSLELPVLISPGHDGRE